MRLNGNLLRDARMYILFVIGQVQGTPTAFDAAKEISEIGRVCILFAYGGCRHATDQGLVDSLGFSDRICCLRPHYSSGDVGGDVAEGVEALDYAGWVGLIEAADRIVSWF
jgi:hypothetical protein